METNNIYKPSFLLYFNSLFFCSSFSLCLSIYLFIFATNKQTNKMLYRTLVTIFLFSATVNAGSFHRESATNALKGLSFEKRADPGDPCLGCGDQHQSCVDTCKKYDLRGKEPHPVCYMRQKCYCGFIP